MQEPEVLRGPEQSLQRDGRWDGLQPVQVVDGGVQEPEVDEARRDGHLTTAQVALTQRTGVEIETCLAQFVTAVLVRPARHAWFSPPRFRFPCSRIPDWAMR